MVVRCGVIGLGYWGPNLVRNISASSATQLVGICDQDAAKCEALRRQYAAPVVTYDPHDLFNSPMIDALFIATPVATHYSLALSALRSGKHVFVEKPLTSDVAQAEHLVSEAERLGLTLMVDHVFVYNPAVQKIRELISTNMLGQILYYDSVRVNLGLFQHDVSVIWDLIVHDLSIVDYIIDERPTAVLTNARAHVIGQPENIAYMTCIFASQMIAHFHVNWLAPVKVRRTLVGGSRRMIVYDDLEPDEKIKVYDRGVDITQAEPDQIGLQFGYRLGDMFAPMLRRTEALKTAVEHFAECIRTGTSPITDGQCGLRTVRLLEAASRSAQNGGSAVAVGA